MKFILFISLIVIITLAGNVFAKDYLIEQSNEKNIKYADNLVIITIRSGFNMQNVINKLEKDFNFTVKDRILYPHKSLTYNKALVNAQLLLNSIRLNKIYLAEEPLLRTYIIELNNQISPKIFCKQIKKGVPYIEFAEPYEFPELLYSPNDSQISNQLPFLSLIKAYQAWDIEKGSPDIIIGISDSGVDQDHEDIKDNLAVNFNEIPGDNIDNDNNGYIDDYQGYNFAWKYDGVNPGVTNGGSITHGLQVAGLAGAATDNQQGIAGVGFKSKIFPLKIIEGSVLKYAYKSIMYAAQQGFKVLNLSWGSPKYASDIDQLVIDYAVSRNVAIVAAAGNTGSGSANNYSSFYPATYKGVLGVGEVSATGLLTNESVMGIGTRIMAPGEGDFTTKSNNSYGMCEGGSSFSSPVVAGAVALARSRYPDLDAIQTIEFVRQCTDTFVNQNNKYYKLAPGIINLQKIVTIDPMSIPALRPEKFLYSNSDGFVTDRFSAGDLVHLKVSLKNYLGAANSLTFVLSEAYDPANAVSIVDSVKVIASVAQNGEIELEDFVIAILQNYAEEVILRIDIYGDNGYKDFFKFGFIPIKQITTFENNNFFISLSDNGELGFFTENDTVGSGFGLKNTGNQIYQNSTIMVSEFINENKNRIIYNDNDISRYDFKSIKKFLPPDANLGIINDDFASNNKLGVEIQQRLEFIDDNSNSVRIKLDIKNTGKDTLENVSIGYFIDWDIAGEADNNQVRYLPIDLPTGGFSSNFAVEIATYNDDYPIFGSGVYTNALNVSPQAAGLDYNYIRDFLPNERIATLNSGINIQTDLTTDISSVIGMRFNGKLLPGTSQNCLVCLAAGNSLDEFRLEMIKCLGIPSSVNYNNNITDLEIYPNPANDNIIIRQLSRNANELFIYNQLGNVIHSVMITDSEMKVDISDIANGIYFMISKSKSGKVIDKGTFIILK